MVETSDRPWTQEDEQFWGPIITPNGRLDLDQVKRELHDYHTLLEEVPKVYCELTGGAISKPNTAADAVIAMHDDCCHEECIPDPCPNCDLSHPWACVECGETLK